MWLLEIPVNRCADSEMSGASKWVSTDKPHMIERLPVGEYMLREELAPDGYIRVIQPFAFEPDSWQEPTHTFNIDRRTLQNLMIANER